MGVGSVSSGPGSALTHPGPDILQLSAFASASASSSVRSSLCPEALVEQPWPPSYPAVPALGSLLMLSVIYMVFNHNKERIDAKLA